MRKAVFLAVLVAAAHPAAATAVGLAPGVVYKREVRLIGHKRVVVHILEAPKPGGLYSLRPVLSNGTVTGRETVSSMQRRLSRKATVAGVNGDLFTWASGRPSGIFLRAGRLATRSSPERSSLGIGLDGLLRTEVVRYDGTWRVRYHGLRVLKEFNHPLERPNGVALFTPAWGRWTPRLPHGREVILAHVARIGPNEDIVGQVVARSWHTGHAIPPGGAVLQAAGDRRQVLLREAQLRRLVKLRVNLTPWWSGVEDAIGGGPRLVTGGVPVFQAGEHFSASQLLPRNPRTAVGQLANGRVVLVAIDGRASWSAGVTNSQLARLMAGLGSVTAMALDAGGSTTMAFNGHVLNHPSEGAERAVGDALMVFYYGIYARPPRLAVYSPNGDGVADVQHLYAKVVRPAHVDLRLERVSDGHVVWRSSADRGAGIVVKPVTGQLSDGKWQWVVSAVDRAGRTSQMTRVFATNSTLGFLHLSRSLLEPNRHGGRLIVSLRLSRSAYVRVTVRNQGGKVVRHLLSAKRAAGPVRVAWNVRNDRRRVVRDGRFFIRVRAANAVGRVALTKSVRVRRRF